MPDPSGLSDVCWLPATGRLTARLSVPAGHPVLAGHFPTAPLVPGVLLLDAVRMAYEIGTGDRVTTVGVDDVRFHQPLLPEAPAELAATAAVREAAIEIEGEWTAAGQRLAAFRLRLLAATREPHEGASEGATD